MTTAEARYWDATLTEWERDQSYSLWRKHSDRVNRALIAGWLPNGRSRHLLKTDLFDEAVAEGLIGFLHDRAAHVTGIDLSGRTAHLAAQRTGAKSFGCADVRRLPFGDGTFDGIFSGSTLDHFVKSEDLVTSLQELYRVLRPGGRLLLTLDNPANPMVALRNALPFTPLHRIGLVPYYVGATCGPARLRALLDETGFDTNSIGASVHCPRVVAVHLARLVERYASSSTQEAFLRLLMRFEHLARWPTRFRTGYFVVAFAQKRLG